MLDEIINYVQSLQRQVEVNSICPPFFLGIEDSIILAFLKSLVLC